ncbi:esterase, putative [Acidisarcina polymorpha]|uniref:Esterase, putative n=1 Tax=Acidisarcina polymorpha TaxID=2211140 RepID=A0A2Z5FXH6_9BACT|nr:alpha/beta fold hydrolase [Acidisarcina polymorpha]AXC11599.1 esterase, putative [Acidisarcina polymorpha]
MKLHRHFCLVASVLLLAAIPASPQATHGAVQHITVHGKLLEGNLLGDTADRPVSVYLPPSYATQPDRRYPVVYFLHGFTDSDTEWFGQELKNGKPWINLPEIADRVFAADPAHEMILIVPNANNKFKGSFYSSSVTTGDWEDYIVTELVAYIDQHYRTIARPESRGLGGHSMGGYGTLRLGMKHADVFSSIYALSPCCLIVSAPAPSAAPAPASQDGKIHAAAQVKSDADLQRADFFTLITLAFASAWSPNPGNPPFYLDLPTADGKPRLDVVAKWLANAPLVILDQYAIGLKHLHAIAFDAGTNDEFKQIPRDLITLDRDLTLNKIPHTYETYAGSHIDHIPQRLEEKVLPFFARNLSFTQPTP